MNIDNSSGPKRIGGSRPSGLVRSSADLFQPGRGSSFELRCALGKERACIISALRTASPRSIDAVAVAHRVLGIPAHQPGLAQIDVSSNRSAGAGSRRRRPAHARPDPGRAARF